MTRRQAPVNIEAIVARLLTRSLAVIVGLDAVGLAIGCVLRRRQAG
jgi:hypothetical protein